MGAKVKKLRFKNADNSPPLPSTDTQYMANHACLDAEVLKELCLAHTHILSHLWAAQMADTKCERLFRDHSQKFCSKLKIYGYWEGLSPNMKK
ncbi:hypothetical protein GN244_ATG17282 [Phytophthora infestans]|uniref:Uncharacterized protein n=1 Tax=Phytophthora infestans TaxID=4787 RepID=A0A833RQU8_PHYIN|nr:hypothetical protein GN244_ATG17282 [Phytophthora infestans]